MRVRIVAIAFTWQAYSFLGAFGLMEVRGGGTKDGSPSEHASSLNTFLGTGKVQRDTRTSGSYGSSRTRPVNASILGNLHWSMFLTIERGLTGNHVACTKERFVICAGRPARRHADLPEGYDLPQGQARWVWLPLTARLARVFGWEEYYQVSAFPSAAF